MKNLPGGQSYYKGSVNPYVIIHKLIYFSTHIFQMHENAIIIKKIPGHLFGALVRPLLETPTLHIRVLGFKS